MPETRRALALTVSTRAASGEYADTTGPVIAEWLERRGWTAERRTVADAAVHEAFAEAVASGVALIVSTGGTGISPDDRTPEAAAAVIDLPLPGFGEELRRRGAAVSLHALLGRAEAGVAGSCLVVTLPGSRGGVADGLDILDGLLEHAVHVRAGGDHGRC